MTSPSRRRRQMAVRASEPPPSRFQQQRQLRVAALAVAGVVVVVIAGVLLFGGGGPARPTPSGVAGISPRPTTSAAGSLSAIATSSGSLRPSLSPLLTVLPTPSRAPASLATGSFVPTPSAGAPLGQGTAREATFVLLGIDDKVAPEGIPRRITFNVDGAGEIRAEVAEVSAGTVRMCLYQSDGSREPGETECTVTDGGVMTATPTTAGPWTVWLFGDEPGRSPSATVVIKWSATTAAINLANFRFQGIDSPNYTGFNLQVVPAADGQLVLNATWDDGQGGDYPFVTTLTDLDGSGEPPVIEGTSDHATAQREVKAGRHYEAAIENQQDNVVVQVLLSATVTWP